VQRVTGFPAPDDERAGEDVATPALVFATTFQWYFLAAFSVPGVKVVPMALVTKGGGQVKPK
jgi:hypothetical protein